MIRYAAKIENCTVLGPCGERAVIWVHGCCFDCKGCIAENYKYGPYAEASAEELAKWYLLAGRKTEGITISGGEPFLQAGELAKMIRLIRKKREIGVVVYTGFLYEELKRVKDFGLCHNEEFKKSTLKKVMIKKTFLKLKGG